MRLCQTHAESGAAHDCPEQKRLLEIASDPTKLKAWKLANAPEEAMRTQIILALNLLPDVHVTAVDSGHKGGNGLTEPGFADIVGRSRPDGIFIAVESKNSHAAGERQKGECACKSCKAQRAWGASVVEDGGVYVAGVRTVAQAVDGVRIGLARARAKTGAAA